MAVRVFLLCTLASQSVGWRSEGVLPTTSSFAEYVGKFCFDYVHQDEDTNESEKPIVGLFEVDVRGKVGGVDPSVNDTHGDVYFAVFDDEKDHWRRARPFWDELTCSERLELASWSMPLSQHLRFSPHQINGTIRVRQAIRPRFWYFTFINCGVDMLEPLNYAVHALNIHQGFQAEFGMDVQGSIGLEASLGLLFTLVLLVTYAMSCSRSARLEGGATRMSPLLRVLALSAACSAAGCAFRVVHHAWFAVDGKGLLLAAVLGTTCACAARALLTVLQLLIARGWALLLMHDERAHRYGIIAALGAVIGLSVGCEIWEQYFHDQSTTFYLYESWPGRVILGLNLCLLAVAWQFMWNTYKRESLADVRMFYRLVSAACGIYFAFLPVVCLVAELLNPWHRRKYVERAELGTRFAATLMLLICLRPSHLDSLVAARLKNREQPKLLSSDTEMSVGGGNSLEE